MTTTKLFTGTYWKALQQCVKEGYTPATAPKVMSLRRDGEYKNTYVDTASFVAYNGKGNIKIVHSLSLEQVLRFKDSFIVEDYKKLKGKELTIAKLQLYSLLTKAEVLKHPIWIELAGGDKKLLKQYADMVFSEVGGENMAVWLYESDTPYVRPWFLGGVDGRVRSGASDRRRLDYPLAQLVGVKEC